MEVCGGKERHGSVVRQHECTSSKQHTSVEEYEDNDGDRRGNKYARVETVENWAEMETLLGVNIYQKRVDPKVV